MKADGLSEVLSESAKWRLFQLLIVFAVGAANIHWQWTPNPWVIGFLGVLAAMIATALLSRLIDWQRHGKARWQGGWACQEHPLDSTEALRGWRQPGRIGDAQRRAG